MADLLETLNIRNRMINSIDLLNNSEIIDYDSVYERLCSLRKLSYDYIDKVLSFALQQKK